MLEWMQKHKKYLVIMVWISALALVFASLVEWGGGGFSAVSRDHIAKVGNEDIKRQEYENMYYNIYNALKQFYGFDETGQKLPEIEEEAFKEIVKIKLLQVLANEFDVSVTPDEIVSRLVTIPEFLDSTKHFNKQQYLALLEANHLTPEEYEQRFAQEILYEKMNNFPLFPVSELEINSFLSANKIQDNIAIKVMTKDSILKNKTITLSESEIKTFWEFNKQKYYEPENYKIAYIAINFNDIPVNDTMLEQFYNDNATQYAKDALQTDREKLMNDYKKYYIKAASAYIAQMSKLLGSKDYSKTYFSDVIINLDSNALNILKNQWQDGESVPLDSVLIHYVNLTQNDIAVYPKIIEQVSIKDGLIEPIEYANENWIVPFVIAKTPKKQLSYDDSRNLAEKDLYKQKENEEFKKIAQSQFHAMDLHTLNPLGFVSIADTSSTDLFKKDFYKRLQEFGLTDSEITDMIGQLMMHNKRNGTLFLGNEKVVFFNIINQKMPSYDELINITNNEMNAIEQSKTRDLRNAMLDYATNKYKIIDYRRQN